MRCGCINLRGEIPISNDLQKAFWVRFLWNMTLRPFRERRKLFPRFSQGRVGRGRFLQREDEGIAFPRDRTFWQDEGPFKD